MRTAITTQKEMTYAFPMTDADILERVREVNVMRSSLTTLENKKKLLSQEIKSVETEMEQMLNNISRREEEREVQCDVCFDYEKKTVETMHLGQIMESRRMTDWEYSQKPEDIFPEVSKHKVAAPVETKTTEEGAPVETAMEAAMKRAEEIKAKEENMVAPSADTKAFSEAKTEQSTIINMPS